MSTEVARINAVGTAVPDQDIHHAFIEWAAKRITEPRAAKLFARMSARSGISHRYSVLPVGDRGSSPVSAKGFYAGDRLPGTAERMMLYAQFAPELALQAVKALACKIALDNVTHLVVASCTGFIAPGIDQIIARRLGLSDTVERLLVGFMGCYAAIAALRSARHIVRSDASARVLAVTVELSTLHLQSDITIEPLLAMLQFGDGAAAALVSGEGEGFLIERPFAINVPESDHLIRWTIGDEGFAMHLSGEVPGRIAEALKRRNVQDILTHGDGIPAIEAWAVHAGGRSILDAVSNALDLPPAALDASRNVLQNYGNMSSATLMFALDALFPSKPKRGVAIAFGPGLACEGFGFAWTGGA